MANASPAAVNIGAVGLGAISVSGPLTDSQTKEWISHHKDVVLSLARNKKLKKSPTDIMIGQYWLRGLLCCIGCNVRFFGVQMTYGVVRFRQISLTIL